MGLNWSKCSTCCLSPDDIVANYAIPPQNMLRMIDVAYLYSVIKVEGSDRIYIVANDKLKELSKQVRIVRKKEADQDTIMELITMENVPASYTFEQHFS